MSEQEILATADAIRAMTPVVTPLPTRDECENPRNSDVAQACRDEDDAASSEYLDDRATRSAEVQIEMGSDAATEAAQFATDDAADAEHKATLEAEASATEEAAFLATMDAYDATVDAARANILNPLAIRFVGRLPI